MSGLGASVARMVRGAGRRVHPLLPHPVRAALRNAAAALRTFGDPHATFAYGQEGEDLILLSAFAQHAGPGFFVDVGAHHPERYSNTRMLYQRGWHGINIEPNPAAAPLFGSSRPRDVNLTMGVSEHAGALTYYAFDEPAVNTFDAEQARSTQAAGRFRLVATRTVPVERLDAILDRHLPPGRAIDVLTVDVEGHDLAVLRSNDWSRYRPRCVLVEIVSGAEPLADSPTHQFLTEQGYEMFARTVVTVIYRDACAARAENSPV